MFSKKAFSRVRKNVSRKKAGSKKADIILPSSLKTRMNSSIKNSRNNAQIARLVTFWGVVVCSVMVAITLILSIFFNEEAIAHRKFEHMAREYYEDYYYQKFISSISEDMFEQKMQTFSTTGLQPVLLRQLLLYQNGKNSEYRKYFDTKNFSCDRNTTSAQFFPVSPYGPKDYEVKFNYSCQYQ